jgi:hypothetical protein
MATYGGGLSNPTGVDVSGGVSQNSSPGGGSQTSIVYTVTANKVFVGHIRIVTSLDAGSGASKAATVDVGTSGAIISSLSGTTTQSNSQTFEQVYLYGGTEIICSASSAAGASGSAAADAYIIGVEFDC